MSKTPFLPAVARLVFSLVLLALAIAAQAQSNFPPDRLTYQGFLVDGLGNALATNTPKNYDVIFRIYATQTGTNSPLWGEQQTVTVDKGFFSVLLGEGTVVGTRPSFASLLAGSTNASDRYVGLTVKGIGAGNSDVDILPRLRLLPAPYAFLARGANALVSNGGSNVVTVAGNAVSISGPLAATSFSGTFTGSAAGLSGLTSAQIPNLDAGKITTGTLDTNRIPNLDAGKIASGTLNASRIPDLAASKITTGNLADARLSANVALRGTSNTFSGQQTFNGHLQMANATILYGVNSGGNVVECLIPRWSDNSTYFNYGAGGLYVRNNAGTPRMFVSDGGNVGIGTTAPKGKLHVNGDYYGSGHLWLHAIEGDGNSGTAYVQARDDSSSSALNMILRTKNGNTLTDAIIINANGLVGIKRSPTYSMDVNGTVRCDNLIESSDRRLKENFVAVDTRTVLEKVVALPITRWNFTNETGTVHLGPMAQDFHAAFGLGTNDTVISSTDARGVALAAIQGLHEKVRAENRSLRDSLDAKDAELAGVKERLAALEELVKQSLGGAKAAK